jgi:hypothetical protein
LPSRTVKDDVNENDNDNVNAHVGYFEDAPYHVRLMRLSASALLGLLVLVSGCSSAESPESPAGTHPGDDSGRAGATWETGSGGYFEGGSSDGLGEAGLQEAGLREAGAQEADGPVTCSVDGVGGQCLDVTECAGRMGYTSTPGYCPGPAAIECCTLVPSVANNPPVPDGWKLMSQADVTPDMTAWAVAILDDPTSYPMFSTTMRVFGTLTVMARVEWHPPDFQNSAVHRGVTLYVPM